MKTFRNYLEESEYLAENPTVGDGFVIEIAREEIVLETTVIDIVEDGIVIEADETMMRILTHVGYLTEDSHMSTAGVYKQINSEHSSDDDLEEAEKLQGWGQDSFTLDDGSVMKYDSKSDSYSQASGATKVPTKTSMSVVDTHRTKSTNSSKKGSTFDQEYYSTSLARDPKTGAGDYLKTQLKGDDYKLDYQTGVSKPWMDYTLNKARQDADTMMQEPDGPVPYKSMPQGPMAQFRATTNEAKYRGRTVPLGKKMAGDVKKSKVYVRGPKGNVVKVNFGDPNMTIKKSNPARRKSFRARHNCANPGPRWKARYWSCRSW
jgi:hypothetical protein